MSLKQCICGRSQRFPICDYSHKEESWSCRENDLEVYGDLFVAADHLSNYAEKLAFELKGASLHRVYGTVVTQRLIVLTDGLSIAKLKHQLMRVQAQEFVVIGLGIDAALLKAAFPKALIRAMPSVAPSKTWVELKKVMLHLELEDPTYDLPDLFCSHAVQDEDLLFPAVETLRDAFGLNVFFCADSIQQGAQWRSDIMMQLRSCELFIFCASKAASSSLYCSFELGMAVALNKPIRVLSIDSSGLPAPIADLQALDLGRLNVRKPWLDSEQLLLDAFLSLLNIDSQSS